MLLNVAIAAEPEPSYPTAVFAAPRYASRSELLVIRDKKGTQSPVRTPDDWKIRRQHILAAMQEVMGPLPDRSKFPAFDMKILETVKGDGYQRLTISLAGDEKDRIPAYLYLPDDRPAGKKLPGAIALQPTGEAGKGIVDDKGPLPNRGYGKELAQRGYIVIAPDYPSFGDLKKHDFLASNYLSGTMKGIANHMRCLDYLASREDVDAASFAAIGHSLGGHNSMFLGVFDERVKVVVSSCGWSQFRDYYGYFGGKLSGWAQDRYMPRIKYVYDSEPDRVPFDFYEVIAALAPRAFLTVSPINDHNFDVESVRRTLPVSQKVFDLLKVSDNLQAQFPTCRHDFPDDMRRASYAFIDKHLKHTPARQVP
jgi:pimeloyl-ACP methyl ester carboxylesterase